MPNTSAREGGQQHAYTCQAVTHSDSLPFLPSNFLCTSRSYYPHVVLSSAWALSGQEVLGLPYQSPQGVVTPSPRSNPEPRKELLGQKMSFPLLSWSSNSHKKTPFSLIPSLLFLDNLVSQPQPAPASPLFPLPVPTVPLSCFLTLPPSPQPWDLPRPAQLTLSSPCKAPGMPRPLLHPTVQPHT